MKYTSTLVTEVSVWTTVLFCILPVKSLFRDLAVSLMYVCEYIFYF